MKKKLFVVMFALVASFSFLPFTAFAWDWPWENRPPKDVGSQDWKDLQKMFTWYCEPIYKDDGVKGTLCLGKTTEEKITDWIDVNNPTASDISVSDFARELNKQIKGTNTFTYKGYVLSVIDEENLVNDIFKAYPSYEIYNEVLKDRICSSSSCSELSIALGVVKNMIKASLPGSDIILDLGSSVLNFENNLFSLSYLDNVNFFVAGNAYFLNQKTEGCVEPEKIDLLLETAGVEKKDYGITKDFFCSLWKTYAHAGRIGTGTNGGIYPGFETGTTFNFRKESRGAVNEVMKEALNEALKEKNSKDETKNEHIKKPNIIERTQKNIENSILNTENKIKQIPQNIINSIQRSIERKLNEMAVNLENKIKRDIEKNCMAEAAYGATEGEDLATMRDFRDDVLKKNIAGLWFTGEYYEKGQSVANYLSLHETVRETVRTSVFVPTAWTIRLLSRRTF